MRSAPGGTGATASLSMVERDLAPKALADQNAKRLMTIPGIDMVVAMGRLAAIGDAGRFASPQVRRQRRRTVSYLGLNPSVRQSGPGPAHHGRITKQGRGHARGMLVEAALRRLAAPALVGTDLARRARWAAAARAPDPLRAFFLRLSPRRGQHIAAVAAARQLAVIVWHRLRRQEAYAWGGPALHAKKIRDLELRAGHPARRGQRGAAYADNLAAVRERERRQVEQAEKAYQRLVQGWNARGPKARPGAAKEERP